LSLNVWIPITILIGYLIGYSFWEFDLYLLLVSRFFNYYAAYSGPFKKELTLLFAALNISCSTDSRISEFGGTLPDRFA
jgi:hypothetical protein